MITDKAGRILQKMRKGKAAKPWRLFRSPETRDRVLGKFNGSTLDDVGPLGGDQSMGVLKEMNDLQSAHEEFVNSAAPRVDVL